jgi:hypothetical protein
MDHTVKRTRQPSPPVRQRTTPTATNLPPVRPDADAPSRQHAGRRAIRRRIDPSGSRKERAFPTVAAASLSTCCLDGPDRPGRVPAAYRAPAEARRLVPVATAGPLSCGGRGAPAAPPPDGTGRPAGGTARRPYPLTCSLASGMAKSQGHQPSVVGATAVYAGVRLAAPEIVGAGAMITGADREMRDCPANPHPRNGNLRGRLFQASGNT